VPFLSRHNPAHLALCATKKGKGASLNYKQNKFIPEYLRCGDYGIAAKKAGYNGKNLDYVGFKVYNHPLVYNEIQKRLAARADRMELKSDYVIDKLKVLAEEAGKDGDKIRSLELLGRTMGLFRDRQEISGPDGEAIKYEQKVKEDADAFTSAITKLNARGREENILRIVDAGSKG
jgi:Terminase small subunit